MKALKFRTCEGFRSLDPCAPTDTLVWPLDDTIYEPLAMGILDIVVAGMFALN